MAKKKKGEQSKGNKLQWFFFVIVVPVVFAITLMLIVFTLLGVNVFNYAEKYSNKIPGISSVISTTEEKEQTKQSDQLQATIANNNAEIEQLNQELDRKQRTIDDLEQEITSLEAELASKTEVDEKQKNRVSDLASSFQEMKPSLAAPIIKNMDQALAIQVMENISSEVRGEILGAMDAKTAAELASSFMGSPTP